MSIPGWVVATGVHCGGSWAGGPWQAYIGPESCSLLSDFSILSVPPELDACRLHVPGSLASQGPAVVIHHEKLGVLSPGAAITESHRLGASTTDVYCLTAVVA